MWDGIVATDAEFKKQPDANEVDPMERMIIAIIAFALIVLKYNKGVEQRDLAVNSLLHFAKIAEITGNFKHFVNEEVIDEMVKELSGCLMLIE